MIHLTDFDSDNLLIELARTMSRIHATPPPTNISTNSLFMEGIRWYQSVGHELSTLPSVMEEAYRIWLILHKKIDHPGIEHVMQHGDFNQKNMFLKDGRIILVDWEFACFADPRREIARVCVWYGLETNRREIFLNNYYEREPTKQEKNEIAHLECMINLELCWRILSLYDHASLGKTFWDELYEKTAAQSLRDFALDHGRPDQKEFTSEKIQTYAVGHLKYFLQTYKDLL